ncbi:MAG: restriction endonuclease subunit S [Thermaceae bacterium]|nr:restriction endonuclease subunit S [Thermaceae bacterium]
MTEPLEAEANQEQELPAGWAWATIGDLASYLNGRAFSEEDWNTTGRPIIRIQNLTGSRGTLNRYPGEVEDRYVIRDGDLLFSWAATLGVYVYRGEEAVLNQHIFKVVPKVNKLFLFYLLQNTVLELQRKTQGTGMVHITKGKFESHRVRLPPLEEQRRIVEKLEALFSELDSAVQSLEAALSKLKRYRQAVLKAAVEGELSREWREAHQGQLEPASELLKRILAERRQRWEEAELAKMQAKGKIPQDDKWKARYVEPEGVDSRELPELPEGWVWVRLDAVAALKGGITKDSKRKVEAAITVPYLRVANVQRGYLDLSEVKTIKATREEVEELRLLYGDVLFNEGGDRDKLGRGWIWRDEIPNCIHQNHVYRGRIYSREVIPQLISWCSNSYGQQWFLKHGKQTTNLASINLTLLSSFPVPLIPLLEQRFIVQEVDRLLSEADKAEEAIRASLKRAERLRQAVLREAFSGRLVPQDPADEPAAVLLERIRAARQAEAGKKGSGKRKAQALLL